MRLAPLLASTCLLALFAGSAAAAPAYTEVHATRLGAPDRWDYVLFDPSSDRVFVAHGNHTDVVDGHTGRVEGHVGPLDGAHGTVVAPVLGRGFADGGKSRSLTGFSLTTLKPIGQAQAGEDADAVAYDPGSRHVFVINGDSGTISVIDAATLKPLATIDLGAGGLEFAASDGHGSLFVNLAEAGGIARIDIATNTVTARWKLAGCVSPHGLAYDDLTRRLFTSCENGALKVINAEDGHVVASLPIGKGSDSVAVDPKRRLVFSANGTGTLSIIAIHDADHFTAETPLQTPKGARTMAVDPATGRIFLASATADGTTPPPIRGGHARMHFVPGSLKLLMFDPS
ncbi:YncE family protein [Lichenicoccus sp.]|uniref:YncE family protein n=1 Tax=Lichenicoccus sp. TaxID=2781899 RepID=UPI003D0A575E